MFIIIAGGGRIGYNLLKSHVDKMDEVVIIEIDRSRGAGISDEMGNLVMSGDACDPSTLEAAGISRADMIVACTGRDEDNLIICQIARKKFRVPYTITLVNEPQNEEVFKKLGVDETVSAIGAVQSRLEQKIALHGTMTILAREGGIEIVETRLPEDSPAVMKTLDRIPLPQDCFISAIIREGRLIRPENNLELLAGDIIISAQTGERFKDLKKAFLGFDAPKTSAASSLNGTSSSTPL